MTTFLNPTGSNVITLKTFTSVPRGNNSPISPAQPESNVPRKPKRSPVKYYGMIWFSQRQFKTLQVLAKQEHITLKEATSRIVDMGLSKYMGEKLAIQARIN